MLKLNITGKNIERFIKRLISLDIELYKIDYLKYNEINIIINNNDYSKIKELKTIYEIKIIELYGFNKIKYIFKKYKYILSVLVISFLFIIFLSNIIFKVEIIHNDKNIRKIIREELVNNNIKPMSLIKSYKYISKVKKKILKKYKDKIEWLEIERQGTKYIVKVEERILNKNKETLLPRNIVAKKDATILYVEAESGEIIKNKNDYVHKGDIIISGSIYLNENLKENKAAIGKVYGEVWYKVEVEYPLTYYEEKILSDEKNIYSIEINSFKFKLNKIKNYNVKKSETKILKHLFLPISLTKETYKKVKYIKQNLTKEEAINKAIKYAKDKVKSKLNEKEYIISTKKLKVEENNSKIIVEIFFTVYEDITEYALIEGE